MWHLLLWLLTFWSAEPNALEIEAPKAAAAVAAARASLAQALHAGKTPQTTKEKSQKPWEFTPRPSRM